jgi:hypothetical protein
MVRIFAVGATLALVTSLALADDRIPRYAGTKGTITAWDESSTKVLEHRFCVKTRSSWDYVTCGNHLRDALKRHVCAVRGRGTYKYLTQVGDGKPYESTLFCR